jgi:biotin carboxylase
MKTALRNHGVPTPAFATIRDLDDLRNAQSLGFPLVLKALDLQGSRGVYIVADLAEAERAFDRIMEQSRRGIAMAESFVPGQEFGAQAFVYHGELVFVMPHGDTVLGGSSIIPIGHHVPWGSDVVSDAAVAEVVGQAVQAIGLDNCAVNIDLMASDGRLHVLELTGRAGANALPELVSAAHGIDYYSMIAVTALGGDPRPLWARQSPRPNAAASAMILPPAQPGQIRSIRADTSLLDRGASAFDEIVFFGQVGDTVRGFTSSADCLGQVVVSASTLAQAQDLLEQVLASIVVQIEDGL